MERPEVNITDLRNNTGQLIVLLTRKCQFDCTYCKMDRDKVDLSKGDLFKAIDLLFTSKENELELQFFGGEPLLRFDLVKDGIIYAEKNKKGRSLKYVITTNGLLLSTEKIDFLSKHNVTLMFSIDNAKDSQNRRLKGGKEYLSAVKKNIHLAINSGCDYFINMVVSRGEVSKMFDNFKSLVDEGFYNIQIAYSLGVYWDSKSQIEYTFALDKIKGLAKSDNRIKLFNNEIEGFSNEPVFASPVIIVDVDSSVYVGCSIVIEKELPSLSKLFCRGALKEIPDIGTLLTKKSDQFNSMWAAASGNEQKIIRNNLEFGLNINGSSLDYKNIDFAFQNNELNSLVLMVTYKCQMDCSYCRVIQKNASINADVYKKAVKLLFSSQNEDILLRFFGGEPLLYPNLVLDIINYAEEVKKEHPGKKIRYLITTNVIDIRILEKLKQFDVELMMSIDGNEETMEQYRNVKTAKSIMDNLAKVQKSGIEYFVNMLVTPLNVSDMVDNFCYLVSKEVKRIQVCYESGIFWENDNIMKLMAGFERIKQLSDQKSVSFMNLQNKCEPVMLSDEILVDVDGKIYYDIAIFHEKSFPILRDKVFLADVSSVNQLQDLFHSKRQLFDKLMAAYSQGDPKRELIENNIQMGFAIKELIENKLQARTSSSESTIISNLLNGTVSEQVLLRKKFSIDVKPYILHVSNDCKNNCIFCKNKRLPDATLEVIEYKLRSNLEHKLRDICIVGNEPLNHPHVFEIIDLCNKYGFKNIQIMTSAMFLTHKSVVEQLYSQGVTSFSIPIYSRNPETHDAIIQRKGDFNDLLKAVGIVKDFNIKLYLHTNLLKQNLDDINNLEKYVHEKITDNFCILPVRAKYSNLSYDKLVPSYKEMVRKLKVSSLVGFPLCIVKQIQDKLLLDSDKISDSIKIYLLDQNFVKPKSCKGCSLIKNCVGTFKEHVKLYGQDGLTKG